MDSTNTLNIKIEIPGLELLAQAVMKLAGADIGIKESAAPNTVPVQQRTQTSFPMTPPAQNTAVPTTPGNTVASQVPVSPVQQPQIPVTPMQGAVPVQQQAVPVQQAVPTTQVPTTEVPVTHTMDELAVAASQLVNMGKQPRLFEILHGFGVNSLMELPQEKYAAFAGCLKAEGVKF